jgi:formiminoglutamase
LDAHFKLRNLAGGLTNENPVRALLADGLPGGQIVQIGIQSFSNSQSYAAVARSAKISVITREQLRARGIVKTMRGALDHLAQQADVIYVDFDFDVLDRAYAPAAPGSRPEGLTALALRIAARVCGLHPRVRVLDLVEIDPSQDTKEVTSLEAGACVLSFASGLLARLKGRTAHE